jgi:hypothetical protein
MNMLLRWVRKLTRFVLAILLWLNALLLLKVTPPSLAPLAIRIHLGLGEVTILTLIATSSVLLSYGWKNILVDMLYLYFFPFVLLYYFIRVTFWAGSCFVKAFSPTSPSQPPPGSALTIQGQGTGPTVSNPQPQVIGERTFSVRNIFRHSLRPFFQFTLLWSLLLLLASHRWLLWAALIIVLAHLARTLFKVLVLAVFSIKGLSQLEDRIKKYAENLITKILNAGQIEPTQDLRQAWMSISGLQLAIALLRNRQRAVQWMIFIAVLVFGAIYLYIAVLFGFAYYGVARIQLIPYSWGEAFVTSLFILFEVGALPHNIWIQCLGGIHCLFVIMIGAGTIFGYLRKKIDSVYKAADFLNSRFQDEEIRRKIELLNEKFKVPTPATTSAPKDVSPASSAGGTTP